MEEPLIRTLEEQIAEKIKNYRKGTGVYDAEHVDRWISQFPEEERMVVLTETNRLLEQNYVDQAKLMEWERYIETNVEQIRRKQFQKANFWIYRRREILRNVWCQWLSPIFKPAGTQG